MAKTICLSGYYGFHNAGDDAILYAILDALKESAPEAQPVVLSNDPEHTAAQYAVRAVNRWQPSDLVNSLAKSDLLVSGGGSLLQDVTSRHGMLYYLGVLRLAQKLHVPTMIYGQGVGPIRRLRNQEWTAKVFNETQLITVRDAESKHFLESIGVTRPIVSTADPVLGLAPERLERARAEAILRRAGWSGKKPTIFVCVRPWKEQDRVHLFSQALDELVRRGYELVLLPMQLAQDGILSLAIHGHMEEESVILNEPFDTPTLFELFACADLVVGMRLHALIFGAACGKPLLALSYDPKVDAFVAQVGQDRVIPIDQLTSEDLVAHVLALSEEEGPDASSMAYLARLARLPAKMAAGLL